MQRKYKDKACMSCGKLFTPNNARRVFCGDACRYGHATCKVCGKEFSTKTLRQQGQEYCSLRCWYTVPRTVLSAKTCSACRKEFQPRKDSQKTCSEACAHLSKRAERPFVDCVVCGTPLPKYRKRSQRYCSKNCELSNRRFGGFTHGRIGDVRNGPSGYQVVKVGKGAAGAMKHGWMLRHRYVMKQVLGRPLEPHERVHHKNGDRADNRPENLELWKVKKKDPAGVRAADYHCAGCCCFEGHE